MTREQFLAKIEEMLPELNDLIRRKAVSVIYSGAVDLDSYEDDFLLPKIFMSAMGDEIEFQYKPHAKADLKTRENISHFI